MKKGQRILNKLIAILILVSLLCPFSMPNISNAAADVSKARAAIASFAIDFYNKYGTRVKYDYTPSVRGAAYQEQVVGSMQQYGMDCVGWVSYCIHHATGLDRPSVRSGACGFVVPEKYGYQNFPELFDDVTGQELLPGDILSNSHHVMVYVGNDKLIDSRGHGPGGGLTYTTFAEYAAANNTSGSDTRGVYLRVYRLSETAARELNESDLAPIISGLESLSRDKKKDYGYNGMPSRGGYTGSSDPVKNALKWIINKLSQIADYLIGILTMGIKIQLIGWTTIIENVITDMVNEITGTQVESTDVSGTDPNAAGAGTNTINTNTVDTNTINTQTTEETDNQYTPAATETVTGMFTDKNDRLTVEKIIYNQVPILDVNIFNLDEAGGQKLKEDGTLSIIKKNIAKWYYAFRMFAIIVLLVILIYIGIRMAISTVASEKAVYKRYLKDWVVGFIIVFTMHYIMMFILNLNQYTVQLFANSSPNQEVSIYETVRTKAYELKFTSGFAGTVMYMVLVYMVIRFFYVYIKRYLTINILAILAPIIGVSYSIDKIKDNKSQSLSMWLKDFTFTTMIQTVHAMIYTIFMVMAIDESETSLAGIVFAFVIMNFMLKAEQIVTHIFNMGGSKSLSSMLAPNSMRNAFIGITAARSALGFYGAAARLSGRAIKGIGHTVGQIGGVVLPESTRYRFNNWYNQTTDKVLGEGNFLNKRRTNNIQTVSGIDQKIRQQRMLNKALFKKNIKGAFSFGTGAVKFTLKSVVAVPTLVMNPMGGAATLLALRKTRKQGIIKGFRKSRKVVKTRQRVSRFVGNTRAGKTVKNYYSKLPKPIRKGLKIAGKVIKVGTFPAAIAVETITAPMRYTLRVRLDEEGKQISKFEKQNDKGIQNVKMLEEAKKLEEDIIFGYASLAKRSKGLLGENDNGISGRLSDRMNERLATEYDHVVNETLKEIDRQDIQRAISSYIDETGKKSIQEKDLGRILKKVQESIDVRASKKEIQPEVKPEISVREASSNVREKLEERHDKRLEREIDETLKDHKVNEEIDKIAKSNIVKDVKKALATTSDKQQIMRVLDKSLKDNGIDTKKFDNKTKSDIVDNLSRKVKNTKDAVYTPEEIVDVIKKGLDKKNSVKRDSLPTDFDFQDVAENLEKLRQLNHSYEEKFGERILSSEELISSMKKVKRSGKFDLYDSIMNE